MKLFSVIKIFLRATALIALTGFVAWAGFAIWFDGTPLRWLALLLIAALVGGSLAAIVLARPWRLAVALALVPPAIVLGWWLSIAPSNDRDWYADVAQLPTATLQGDILTVRNLRNFDYRSDTDYTEHWETRSYDLSKLVGVDMFLSFWGPTLYAHTITSWEFSDGSHLAISIETRKEKGEAYSAVLGFFRQYELYYVVADERDVIGVRTEHKGENVRLYRLATPPAAARELLLDFAGEMNQLAAHPAWYNALVTNCTTAIWKHAKAVGSRWSLDWRVLANGHLDELGYERGSVNRSIPFAELRERSDITDRARAANGDPDFSKRIREGLPQRPQR